MPKIVSPPKSEVMVFDFKFEDEDTIFVDKNYWQDSVFKE